MNETPVLPAKTPNRSMFLTWLQALFFPNVEFYNRFASAANATLKTALLWLFAAALISTILDALTTLIYGAPILLLISKIFESAPPETQQIVQQVISKGSLALIICLGPISMLLTMAFWLLLVTMLNRIARAMGGVGTLDQLAFTIGAYSAPILICATVLSNFPIIGLVRYVLYLYEVYLTLVALRSVHKLDGPPAVVAILLVLLIPGLFLGCLAVARSLITGS
jgi:hypothetical protein